MKRIPNLKEMFYDLSPEAEEWLFEWARTGGKFFNKIDKEPSITYDESIAEEFASKGFNLPNIETLYRGISLSIPKFRDQFYREFKISSIKELWGKTLTLDLDYPTSWTSDYLVALDFAGSSESAIMVNIFRPEHTIVYTPMFPQRIRGLDESEAVVKPGRYDILFEKPDYRAYEDDDDEFY